MNGLFYYPDRVQNAQEIIQFIDENDWLNEHSGDRRYQHFGYTFNYYILDGPVPMPNFFTPLIRQMEDMCSIVLAQYNHDRSVPYFNQCTVNELLPGQEVEPHTDSYGYGDLIATVTLGTGSTTIFRSDEEEYTFYTQPNSVYYMDGNARWNATHEIPGATEDIDEGVVIPRGRQITLVFHHISNHIHNHE